MGDCQPVIISPVGENRRTHAGSRSLKAAGQQQDERDERATTAPRARALPNPSAKLRAAVVVGESVNNRL